MAPGLVGQSRAIAQLPDGVTLDDTTAAEQQAIQMLQQNPEMLLQLVRTTLAQNPELLNYLQQNPELVQRVANQNGGALMQELRQNPELLQQLQQLLEQ